MGRTTDSPDEEKSILVHKASSLRARIADIERENMKEFLKKQNLERKLKPYELKPGESNVGKEAVERPCREQMLINK